MVVASVTGSLLIVFLSQLTGGFSCPQSWHYYKESCYYPSDSSDRVNQSTARRKCQMKGADLVSINDQAEMNFVLSISPDNSYWFALYKMTASYLAETYWLDGNPSMYRWWHVGEPNEKNQCIRYKHDGFRDYRCSREFPYTCKMPSDSTMTTARSPDALNEDPTTSSATDTETITLTKGKIAGIIVSAAFLLLVVLLILIVYLYSRSRSTKVASDAVNSHAGGSANACEMPRGQQSRRVYSTLRS